MSLITLLNASLAWGDLPLLDGAAFLSKQENVSASSAETVREKAQCLPSSRAHSNLTTD